MRMPGWIRARLGKRNPDEATVTVAVMVNGQRLAEITTPKSAWRR
ncbi:MAG TPA: hypothetical protein VI039_12745 [Solirubrobacterales bacterium]